MLGIRYLYLQTKVRYGTLLTVNEFWSGVTEEIGAYAPKTLEPTLQKHDTLLLVSRTPARKRDENRDEILVFDRRFN